MVIQHNIMAINANRNLGINNSMLSKNLEKLSSGYKINRAGDDAAGLAISEKMRAQITGLEVAQTNAQDAVSLIQTAEGAMTEIHSMLNRMVELASKSANGTYSDANREELQKEVEQLQEEIERIVDNTTFNGISLFTQGTAGSEKITFQIGDTAAQTLGISLADVNSATNTTMNTAIQTAAVDTYANASSAIASFNNAIDTISGFRADLGAAQNRLEHTINNLGVTTENLTAAESRIRDTNMAEEMMAYTKNSVLIQAAQAMLAQANMQPQSVLQLLQ